MGCNASSNLDDEAQKEKCFRRLCKKKSKVVSSDTTGDSLGPDLWGKLLRPLPLISCLKLEHTCGAFVGAIYSGQYRFVWNIKFLDYLNQRDNLTLFGEGQTDRFLKGVSQKIGPFCRSLVLKGFYLPTDYSNLGPNLTRLASLYLKIGETSRHLEQFITSDSRQWCPAELRIVTNPEVIQEKERPPVSFAETLKANATKITSLQLWQMEQTALEQNKALPKLKSLLKYRLYLNDHLLRSFLYQFTWDHGRRLEALYIKWEADQITPPMLASFGRALVQCGKLTRLSLVLNWSGLHKVPPGDAPNFEGNWKKLGSEQMSPSVEKLSLQVEHTNWKSAMLGTDLIAHLIEGRSLKVLRIIASIRDVFPLKLPAAAIETLIVSLHYLKPGRGMGECTGYYELLPKFSGESLQPFIFQSASRSSPPPEPAEDASKPVEDGKQAQDSKPPPPAASVKNLKLALFPLFDAYIARHIAAFFPTLESLIFSGYDQIAYPKEGQAYYDWPVKMQLHTFPNSVGALLKALPGLRVVRLRDKFVKPNLAFLVEAFTKRAKASPESMFLLEIGYLENVKDETCLQATLKVKNLRVY